MEKTCKIVVNLPRSDRPTKITPKAQWWLKEVIKEPKTSKKLQTSLASIKVNDWAKTASMGEFQGKSHCWPKRTKRFVSHLPKKYLDCPQDFLANILLTDKTKVELFGRCVSRYISHKTITAFHKEIIPTVKHGGGSVMVWGCYMHAERLAIIDGTMNSALYQKILKENIWPSACDLKFKCTWVMQQDNDPKTPASPSLNG